MKPYAAYCKAKNAKKRLPEELEDIIMTNVGYTCLYSVNIIKGKLPEKMHNMMILHAIKDPDDYWAKLYFELIK